MTVVLLISLFYRFHVQQDYLVSYEGDCDPVTQSCFVYCETEECSDPFYYSIIERNADRLSNICGDDVTACAEAYSCSNDTSCSVYFCDIEIDGSDACESIDNNT